MRPEAKLAIAFSILLTLCGAGAAYGGFGSAQGGVGPLVTGDLSEVTGIGAVTANATTFTGGLASTDGTRAERFGSSASASGTDSLAVGESATADATTTEDQLTAVGASSVASGDRSTAVGYSADATGTNSVAIGGDANATGVNATAIGVGAQATANNSFAMGGSANSGHTSSIALGTLAATTATSQLVVGADGAPISECYLGEGVVSATPSSALSVNATGGSGADVHATDLVLASGKSTGAGASTDVLIRTPSLAGSSSTPQTLVTRVTVSETSALFTVPVLAPSLVEVSNATVGSPRILTASDSGRFFTNEGSGAVNGYQLPAASAGLRYSWHAQSANGIRITAVGDDVIDLGGVTSAAAGYTETTTQDSGLTLMAVNATEWATTVMPAGSRDAWNVDGVTTGAGANGDFFFSTPAATNITTPTAMKAAGTTTAGDLSAFTHTDNQLTYIGLRTQEVHVTITIGISRVAGGGKLLASVLLYENGSPVTGAVIDRTLDDSSDEGSIALAWDVQASTGDYYEVWLNSTVTKAVTIEGGGMTITAISTD